MFSFRPERGISILLVMLAARLVGLFVPGLSSQLVVC